jgi:hypothetical protein
MADALITPPVEVTDTAVETPTPICACGATEHNESGTRCARGHVLLGNTDSRKHGVRAFETTGRLPDVLRQTVEEFREAVITDRGGSSELSILEQAYCRRLGETEAVVRLLASDLASRGLFTPRGRVRNTFQRWTEAVSQWDRLAQRIGTERRARPLSLRDYLLAQSPQTGAVSPRAPVGGPDEPDDATKDRMS